MVYAKRAVFRRGHRKLIRKRYRKKYPRRNFRSIAIREINKRTEVKSTLANATTSVGLAGTLGYVPIPVQGTTRADRIGDVMWLKSLQIKGQVYLETGIGATYNTFRLVVFQWKTRSPTAPSVSDILANNTLTLAPDVNSLYQKDLGMQFKVLSDRRIIVDSQTPVKNFNIKITKGFNRRVEVLGASVAYNWIFWVILTDSLPLPHPLIDYQARLNWTDA